MPASARAKIAAFEKKIRPWLAEIAASPVVKGRSRTLRIIAGASAGDPVVDAMLEAMHPSHLLIDTLGIGAEPALGVRWVGMTVIIEEARRDVPEAGRFLLSMTYRPRAFGEVAVAPVVSFRMKSDGELHGFEHRFVQSIGEHPIEEVPRDLFLSYFANAFGYYEVNAL